MSTVIGVGLAVAAALLWLVAWGPVLSRLPAPEPGVDLTALDTPSLRATTAVTVLVAGLVPALFAAQPWLWLPLVAVAAPACVVDARTTFLPLRLTQAGWVATILAVGTAAWMADDIGVVYRALAGAAVTGAFFYVAWRGGAIGFGDVRLMLSVGAVAAAQSWGTLLAGLLFGSLVGAIWALLRRARGHGSGAFAYGPALLSGPFLALLLPGPGV